VFHLLYDHPIDSQHFTFPFDTAVSVDLPEMFGRRHKNKLIGNIKMPKVSTEFDFREGGKGDITDIGER